MAAYLANNLFYLLLLSTSQLVLVKSGIPLANRPPSNEVQVEKPGKAAEQPATLAVANIQRPAHLEGVPLERDGKLNKDFRREVLLGEDTSGHHEKSPEQEKKQLETLVKHMFSRADVNKDGKLSEEELKNQILVNTNHHLDEAKKESSEVFQTVDGNGDGKITWEEYKSHFIVEKGLMDKEHVKDHTKQQHPDAFDTNARFLLQEEKDAFEQADADGDGLDEVEWLSFRHPEHSKVMLKEMAEEILKAFDIDKDGVLTEQEFSKVNSGEVTDQKMEQEYIEARKHEFNTMIDKDKDGKATIEELLEFVDPRNERHAQEEVHEIMTIADADTDSHVTLEELLSKVDLLASSGFIHPKARLHDDL
uniref:EF-hand domain-containing protein n=1 Tax=Ditylenchus dipsaci TaxID=166011 RepID=A0A915D573_9BILA